MARIPDGQPLTETQSKVLAQFTAIKNSVVLPRKTFLNIPKNQQISVFDYLLKMIECTIGASVIDVILKKFLDRVFNPNSDELERWILKAMAEKLDKDQKRISQTSSNADWLNANILPIIHPIFAVAKALIVQQIIAMIFGPKNKMKTDPRNQPNQAEQEALIEDAVYSSIMFSLSNETAINNFGETEYNLINLRQQLEKGKIQFVISCQEVNIVLPPDFESSVNDLLTETSTQVTLAGQTGDYSSVPNPTQLFTKVTNFVASETQRINSQENVNAIKKSWLQILVEKVMGLILTTISTHLEAAITRINAENPGVALLSFTVADFIPRPKALKDMSGDEAQFDTNSAFAKVLLNVMYGILISMLFKELVKILKKLIGKLIKKKAKDFALRKLKKFQKLAKTLEQVQDVARKSALAVETLKEIQAIIVPEQQKFT